MVMVAQMLEGSTVRISIIPYEAAFQPEAHLAVSEAEGEFLTNGMIEDSHLLGQCSKDIGGKTRYAGEGLVGLQGEVQKFLLVESTAKANTRRSQ